MKKYEKNKEVKRNLLIYKVERKQFA